MKQLLPLLAVAALMASPAMSQDSGNIPDSEWPAETNVYKPGQGAELAQALCMNCHSTEYVSTQPPMPRKFWEATVKKMKDKYAAPLPEDMTVLVDYLTATYGVK
ncbi:sulfite dehydrogenase (cytochrome) subunit SorB [Roseimicrobium gellanilyticum]|uniref:Sulfite dehydrogenase (Cytochrome) subunit SorB n=1 Tax=Roseimicrobium gellanilyticum TaxID=748857 RepID=A0A366HU69_9BACT|nr:cytochrome c [Roseimicrobium gellanilyticum]RBP47229.1 sulfite dehydrogenase (cytochrome) subunit SorB [Roseimicrobium gellanilyticum]